MAAALAQPPYFVKSYFANSVEETLERAGIELGPEALLLREREAPPEARHLGAFEVVFGVRNGGAAPAAPRPQTARTELRDLTQESRHILQGHRTTRPAGCRRLPDVLASQLIEAGVEATLASGIQRVVSERLRTRSVVQIGRAGQQWSAADVIAEIIAELGRRFEVNPEIGDRCALVGPPGVGKTTSLVKLAVTRGLALRRPVRLISLDDRRIGAAAEIQTYASILGVPCSVLSSTAALAEAIDATPSEVLLLIDTPGQTAVSMEDHGRQLAAFFSQRQDIDIHLILTASAREPETRRAVDRLMAFRPTKLLFTRLDESESMGSVFSEAARTRKPLSFFSTGQVVPEDLAPASKDRITKALARQLPHKLQTDD